MLTIAAAGAEGTAFITTFPVAGEVHPDALVTVKLYVPVASPVIVVLAVLPATDPGLIVQLPAGSPLRTTLPVDTAHVGWVTVPTTGAEGEDGEALTDAVAGAEIQVLSVVLLTRIACDPADTLLKVTDPW